MGNFGVISKGIKCGIIRENDDIVKIVTNSVLENTWNSHTNSYDLKDNDIIAITESVVARAAGLYVTVDEIAKDVERVFGKDATIAVLDPIYSRNRFSMILKGIARAAKKIKMRMPSYDEVGNPCEVNRFTGVNIKEYYKEICEAENCKFETFGETDTWNCGAIYCGLHDYDKWYYTNKNAHKKPHITLAQLCADKNPDFGLLGTNKSTEERLKLFPTKRLALAVCEDVKTLIAFYTGKNVIVCCYGDGAFKDPVGGIWEFADPVTMPGYTDADIIESTPNELKLKAFIDESGNDEELQKNLDKASEERNLVGKMSAMGTTPRIYRDLIASLADLTSGSGNRATPVVLIQNYF